MAEKKKRITITQIVHYSADDKDCGGDYLDVELLDADGKQIATFDDYYHDKGLEKCEGFISGVEYALDVKVKLVVKNVADREN